MRFLRCERGAATVEVAVFVSFLAFVLAGVVDYSSAAEEAMRVQEAASAAAAYGSIPGNENNTAGMISAANAAAAGVHGFTVTATDIYTCTPGGSQVARTYVCTYNGNSVTPYKYVSIQTGATLSPVFAYPGLSGGLTIQGAAVFPVPWS